MVKEDSYRDKKYTVTKTVRTACPEIHGHSGAIPQWAGGQNVQRGEGLEPREVRPSHRAWPWRPLEATECNNAYSVQEITVCKGFFRLIALIAPVTGSVPPLSTARQPSSSERPHQCSYASLA